MDLIVLLDRALKVLTHSSPAVVVEEHKDSIPLMRANYAGEVAAQGLYLGAMAFERDQSLVFFYKNAIEEEYLHLDWCGERISALGGRVSKLNPIWFFGAFCMGGFSQLGGSQYALGFVAETEKQVLEHLQSHLARLPESDLISRNIVEKMIEEESAHADEALLLGGVELPRGIKFFMKKFGMLLTNVSERC